MSARESLQSAQERSAEQPFVWLFLRPAEVDHLCHPFEEFPAQRDFLSSIGVPFMVSPSGRPVVGREAVLAMLNQARHEAVTSTGCQIRSQSDGVRSDLTKSANDASNDFQKNADAGQSRTTNLRKKKPVQKTERGFDCTKLAGARKISLSSELDARISQRADAGPLDGKDQQERGVKRVHEAATRLAELFPQSTMLENVTAAKVLGKKPQTLRRWSSRQSGPIQSTKVVGRIMWSLADLQNLLDGSVSTNS